jgi:hypothetical protein
VQDLGGYQDDHAENDLEESQRGFGPDDPACRCPLEQALLGRRPQWHEEGKAAGVCLRQLAAMTARCLITTLELRNIEMKGQDTGVLAQCPALAHLDLSDLCGFGTAEAERLEGALGQCRELVYLN